MSKRPRRNPESEDAVRILRESIEAECMSLPDPLPADAMLDTFMRYKLPNDPHNGRVANIMAERAILKSCSSDNSVAKHITQPIKGRVPKPLKIPPRRVPEIDVIYPSDLRHPDHKPKS